jgi:hypothetical protein
MSLLARLFAAFVVALSFGALSGCAVTVKTVPAPPPAPTGVQRAIVGFLDTSNSIRAEGEDKRKTPWQNALEKQMQVVIRLTKDLPEGTTYVELYTFGKGGGVVQKYTDLPASHKDLLPTMKRIIAQGPPSKEESGTYFAPAIEKLVERATLISGKHPSIPIVSLFLTDGGVDDMEKAVKAGGVAANLMPGVKRIVALPVKDEERWRLDEVFEPFQADGRFDYSSSLDFNEGYAKTLAVLRGEQPSGGL